MRNETLEAMYRKRFSNTDYLIIVLLAIIVALVVVNWNKNTRILDREAFIDGLAEINERLEEKRDLNTITLLLDDMMRTEYMDGWDAGYGDAIKQGATLQNLTGVMRDE